jgi:hypothetical protein
VQLFTFFSHAVIFMEPRTLRLTDPVEALVVEQALALVHHLRQTCQVAPDGHILAQAELVALARSRELARLSLEAVLNEAVCPAEKKGRRSGSAPVKPRAKAKGRPNGRP